MTKYRVAYIPGDGIGPEIMNEGFKVLRNIEKISDLSFDFVKCEAGAQAYRKTGFAVQPPDWDADFATLPNPRPKPVQKRRFEPNRASAGHDPPRSYQ